MLLLVDNYGSFTYNLYQALGELGAEVMVRRNGALTIEEVETLAPERIVLSPGPGSPGAAGICLALVSRWAGRTPLLGIGLGLHCLAVAFDGGTIAAKAPAIGEASLIYHNGKGVFHGLPAPFAAGRYHARVVDRASLPPSLEITAQTTTGLIMGLRHRTLGAQGVQFDPESILTPDGPALLRNFLAE
ncbi:MAG: anthranilate synthase component II [Chloroflexota bacterium]